MSQSWIARVWQEFKAGNLTPLFRDVLLRLHGYAHLPATTPSHATLATLARCSERTVRRALAHARELGLINWVERRIRRGWRWLRTSNRYVFLKPETAVEAGMRPRWLRRASTGQNGRGPETKVFKKEEEAREGRKLALAALLREAEGMPDLLLARQRAVAASLASQMQARLLGRWGGSTMPAT